MESDFVEECLCVLTRTPATLDALLRDLPNAWTTASEGPGTWSPYVVVGHLIHGEKTDWIPRLSIILEHGINRAFEPFDREAQLRESKGASLPALLDEFRDSRWDSISKLRAMNLTSENLDLRGASRIGPCNRPTAYGNMDRARFGPSFADQSCYGQAVQAGGWPLGGVSIGNEIDSSATELRKSLFFGQRPHNGALGRQVQEDASPNSRFTS